ncbi:MAG: DUF2461 family protein [Ignavibacteria bacterium]|nr:DUF2461 family protein [Ignavibacteria bacterium]
MDKQISPFRGFYRETFQFLSSLSKNNNHEWFRKNYDYYEKYLVEPSRQLVVELSEFLNFINPNIRTEPKFNQTLMRIHKDQRFSKGTPYRDWFLIHFGRYKLDSELYVYLQGESIEDGVFLNLQDNNSHFKENIKRYRKEFILTCKDYLINRKFSLYAFKGNDIVLLKAKFNAEIDYDKILNEKMILISKSFSLTEKKIYSKQFSLLTLKIFSQLYPLLIFSYFTDPLKHLQQYRDNVGILS